MKKRIFDSKGGAGKRVSNGLVALSAAAVLAVYSAGYVRTRAAAARFELPTGGRRSGQRSATPSAMALLRSEATPPAGALIGAPPAPAVEARQRPATTGAASDQRSRIESPRTPSPAPALPAQPLPSTAAAASMPAPVSAPARAPGVGGLPAPAPATAPGRTSAPAPASAPDSTPAPARAPASAVPAPAAPPASAAPMVADAPPVDPAEEPFVFHGAFKKDGTFLGWGYSRHGDIQASVQIENGRIVSAVIAQCLTRYSCDVIDKLPPQVVARQSAEVDHVTGATESADAFYDAVIDALSKVK